VVSADQYADWEAIYRDNVERLYRILFAKVGNRADAEDLTSEVFLAALRPLRGTASVGEVRAYLLATARTVLAAHWRRTLGREVTVLDSDEVAEALTEPSHNTAADAQAQAILAALPPRYRQILRLRFIEACSIREAAAQMQITMGNAKVLQHRALREAAAMTRRGRP
jgi:RNA polymerase sigma factor (sigma-70 family)